MLLALVGEDIRDSVIKDEKSPLVSHPVETNKLPSITLYAYPVVDGRNWQHTKNKCLLNTYCVPSYGRYHGNYESPALRIFQRDGLGI